MEISDGCIAVTPGQMGFGHIVEGDCHPGPISHPSGMYWLTPLADIGLYLPESACDQFVTGRNQSAGCRDIQCPPATACFLARNSRNPTIIRFTDRSLIQRGHQVIEGCLKDLSEFGEVICQVA